MTKNVKKITAESLFFWINFKLPIPKPPQGRPSTKEALSYQKRTSSTSKHKIFKFFPAFVGHFCPPGFGSGFRIRIH
jgi:hypothetical protein